MDSWYRHGLMVLTTPMVFTQTDGIVSVLLDHTFTRGPSIARMLNFYQYKPHYHPQGHVSAWCKEHCNPRNVPELNSVNTVICEQVKFLSTFPFTNILFLSPLAHQASRYKGWKLMFFIRAFGLSDKTVNRCWFWIFLKMVCNLYLRPGTQHFFIVTYVFQ